MGSFEAQKDSVVVRNGSHVPRPGSLVKQRLRSLAVEEAQAEALLRQLRLLPAAFPRAPLQWIPRRAKQQVAEILRERLAEATRLANAPPGDANAERAHLLCRSVAQLLLRAPPHSSEDENGQHTCTGAKTAALVRVRLRLASQGDCRHG